MKTINEPHAFAGVTDTSNEAAESIVTDTPTLRNMVLALIQMSPKTDEEIQRDLDMDQNTQRPRRVELVRLGLVRDSGQRRLTRKNRKAIVWEAV